LVAERLQARFGLALSTVESKSALSMLPRSSDRLRERLPVEAKAKATTTGAVALISSAATVVLIVFSTVFLVGPSVNETLSTIPSAGCGRPDESSIDSTDMISEP